MLVNVTCHFVCVAELSGAQVLPLLHSEAAVIGSSCSHSVIRAWVHKGWEHAAFQGQWAIRQTKVHSSVV